MLRRKRVFTGATSKRAYMKYNIDELCSKFTALPHISRAGFWGALISVFT